MNETQVYVVIVIQMASTLAILFGIKLVIDYCSQIHEELKKQNKDEEM